MRFLRVWCQRLRWPAGVACNAERQSYLEFVDDRAHHGHGSYLKFQKMGHIPSQGTTRSLISFGEYLIIHEKARVPARKDINEDFPLRGFVTCGDCGNPLTANWSKSKTGKKHPYYMCLSKGCESYRKSIRRDELEAAFVSVMQSVTPPTTIYELAHAMVKQVWEIRWQQIKQSRAAAKFELRKIDLEIDNLHERIADTESETGMIAFEKRIDQLRVKKCQHEENLTKSTPVVSNFEEMFELAIGFLANPYKIWANSDLASKKLVLRMTFLERLAYSRKDGFRNPKTTLPFNMLAQITKGDGNMADLL